MKRSTCKRSSLPSRVTPDVHGASRGPSPARVARDRRATASQHTAPPPRPELGPQTLRVGGDARGGIGSGPAGWVSEPKPTNPPSNLCPKHKRGTLQHRPPHPRHSRWPPAIWEPITRTRRKRPPCNRIATHLPCRPVQSWAPRRSASGVTRDERSEVDPQGGLANRNPPTHRAIYASSTSAAPSNTALPIRVIPDGLRPSGDPSPAPSARDRRALTQLGDPNGASKWRVSLSSTHPRLAEHKESL